MAARGDAPRPARSHAEEEDDDDYPYSLDYSSDTPTASSQVAPARLPPRSAPPLAVPLPPSPSPSLPPPVTLPTTAIPLALPLETLETPDHTDALPRRPLPSPRTARAQSLAQSIRRKPLSSTASPAAVRFSKGAAAYADIVADLPRPEQRFARSCSLDSPTLYEFPDRALLATATSLNTVGWPSLETSQPYVSSSAFRPDSSPGVVRVMWWQ